MGGALVGCRVVAAQPDPLKPPPEEMDSRTTCCSSICALAGVSSDGTRKNAAAKFAGAERSLSRTGNGSECGVANRPHLVLPHFVRWSRGVDHLRASISCPQCYGGYTSNNAAAVPYQRWLASPTMDNHPHPTPTRKHTHTSAHAPAYGLAAAHPRPHPREHAHPHPHTHTRARARIRTPALCLRTFCHFLKSRLPIFCCKISHFLWENKENDSFHSENIYNNVQNNQK